VLSLDGWKQPQREICASGPASSGDNPAGRIAFGTGTAGQTIETAPDHVTLRAVTQIAPGSYG